MILFARVRVRGSARGHSGVSVLSNATGGVPVATPEHSSGPVIVSTGPTSLPASGARVWVVSSWGVTATFPACGVLVPCVRPGVGKHRASPRIEGDS